MSQTFRPGDVVRVRDMDIMRRNDSWRWTIGHVGVVKRVVTDAVFLESPINGWSEFDPSVLKLVSRGDASVDVDEGGVV